MRLIPAFLFLLLAAPVGAQCDAARSRAAELKKELDGWIAGHNPGCPLCTAGTACREGFEKREDSRKRLEAWRRDHVGQCEPCAAFRCSAAEETLAAWVADAQARHKEKHVLCEPDRCDPWKALLADVRRKLEDWRRDHPAACDKCSPLCNEWRKRAQDVDARINDTLKRHKDRCAECKSSPCERQGLILADWGKERMAAWKRHGELCPCARAPRR